LLRGVLKRRDGRKNSSLEEGGNAKPISENNFSFELGFSVAVSLFYMLMPKRDLVLCRCCVPQALF